MRTGLKVNVVRGVINITAVSLLDLSLLIAIGIYRSASARTVVTADAGVPIEIF